MRLIKLALSPMMHLTMVVISTACFRERIRSGSNDSNWLE